MVYKVCTKCKKELGLDQFGKRKLGKNGLNSTCKECNSKYGKEWNANNPNYNKEWRKEHIEHSKRYRINNKENRKAYDIEHIEENRITKKQYYLQHFHLYISHLTLMTVLNKHNCLHHQSLQRVYHHHH